MKNRLLNALALTALMIVTAACSKTTDLYEAVPADAYAVASVDVKKMAEAFDIKPGGDDWQWPPFLADNFTESRRTTVERLAACIADGRIVTVILTPKSPVVAMFDVDDAKAFISLLEDQGAEKMSVGDYDTWSVDDISLVVKGSRVWASPASPGALTDAIESLAEGAKDAPFSRLGGLVERLDANVPLCVALKLDAQADDNKDGVPHTVATYTMADNALKVKAEIIYPDGSPYEMGGLETIEPTMLQYVSPSAFAVLAVGLDGSLDWQKQLDIWSAPFASELDPGMRAQMAVAAQYLKMLKGTFIIAFGPAEGLTLQQALEAGMGGWQMLVMARMDQSDLDATVRTLLQVAEASGLPTTPAGPTMAMLSLNGMNFYVGSLDSNLVIANYLPTNNNSNNLVAALNGKEAGLVVDIDNLKPLLRDCDFGIHAEATFAGNVGQGFVQLNPKSLPFFAKIFEAVFQTSDVKAFDIED